MKHRKNIVNKDKNLYNYNYLSFIFLNMALQCMHVREKEAEFSKLVGLVGVGIRINEVCSG